MYVVIRFRKLYTFLYDSIRFLNFYTILYDFKFIIRLYTIHGKENYLAKASADCIFYSPCQMSIFPVFV